MRRATWRALDYARESKRRLDQCSDPLTPFGSTCSRVQSRIARATSRSLRRESPTSAASRWGERRTRGLRA